MTASNLPKINPETDLVLDRVVDVSPDLVWEAWTTPEHLKVWFCPRPWSVSHCEIDLRPGGKFLTTMVSPEGKEFPNEGCFLEVIPKRKLVWTDALLSGYRPSVSPFMTAIVSIEPQGAGTKYTAIALHSDAAERKRHEEMGFSQGWGTALNQMIEHIKKSMT